MYTLNRLSRQHGSICHFKFSTVVQAHTSGEVGILGTVLLRIYSGTILPIFIEIDSYLTDKAQKISWHSFFETRCILNGDARCIAFRHFTSDREETWQDCSSSKVFLRNKKYASIDGVRFLI